MMMNEVKEDYSKGIQIGTVSDLDCALSKYIQEHVYYSLGVDFFKEDQDKGKFIAELTDVTMKNINEGISIVIEAINKKFIKYYVPNEEGE